jgi:hypothetical protein
MKNTSTPCAAFLAAVCIFIATSCQKEIRFHDANSSFISAWSFKQGGTGYEGCVNNADYEMTNGIKLLSIRGNDGLGTFISILLPAPDGKLTAGTIYTAAQGAELVVDDKNGNTYLSNSLASSFQFKVIAITDTSIIATFTANLTDAANGSYVISNGNVSARIGGHNSCIIAGGSVGTSGYSLLSSGANCSDVFVEGDYKTGTALTSLNRVIITVNVSGIGTWTVNTATTDGMKFNGAGTFTTTGIHTIELKGSGTPKAAGTVAFPILGASNTCTFYIPVN